MNARSCRNLFPLAMAVLAWPGGVARGDILPPPPEVYAYVSASQMSVPEDGSAWTLGWSVRNSSSTAPVYLQFNTPLRPGFTITFQSGDPTDVVLNPYLTVQSWANRLPGPAGSWTYYLSPRGGGSDIITGSIQFSTGPRDDDTDQGTETIALDFLASTGVQFSGGTYSLYFPTEFDLNHPAPGNLASLVTVYDVPEPSGLVLSGLAAASLLCLRRGRA